MTSEQADTAAPGHAGKHCATCGTWWVTDRWECPSCESPYRRHPGT